MKITPYDTFNPSNAERRAFASGQAPLDRWLQEFAGQSMRTRDAVTYLMHEDRSIIGYYCLSAASVAMSRATAGLRTRKPPDPIPVILLGRLAVDERRQREGLGAELLRDAVLRAVRATEAIGARALIANALDEAARAFYLKWGFEQSPADELLVMVSLRETQTHLDGLVR